MENLTVNNNAGSELQPTIKRHGRSFVVLAFIVGLLVGGAILFVFLSGSGESSGEHAYSQEEFDSALSKLETTLKSEFERSKIFTEDYFSGKIVAVAELELRVSFLGNDQGYIDVLINENTDFFILDSDRVIPVEVEADLSALSEGDFITIELLESLADSEVVYATKITKI